jgi:hypothetical protein
MRELIAELRRRQVFKAAAIYVVAGWLLLQVVDVLREPFAVPDWTFRMLVVLMIAGFGVAMVLAWMFDLTPQGIRREDPAPAADARTGSIDTPEATALPAGTNPRTVACLRAHQALLSKTRMWR